MMQIKPSGNSLVLLAGHLDSYFLEFTLVNSARVYNYVRWYFFKAFRYSKVSVVSLFYECLHQIKLFMTDVNFVNFVKKPISQDLHFVKLE